MNEHEPIEVEHIAQDRYRLRFRGQIMTVDAQALIDLARWLEVHMTSIMMALDSVQSEPQDEQGVPTFFPPKIPAKAPTCFRTGLNEAGSLA